MLRVRTQSEGTPQFYQTFECSPCELVMDGDRNAAKNIKNRTFEPDERGVPIRPWPCPTTGQRPGNIDTTRRAFEARPAISPDNRGKSSEDLKRVNWFKSSHHRP